MTNDDALQAIDKNIKEQRKVVELSDALTQLRSNRYFRKLIEEGYFAREAIRLVQLKADPDYQTPERQASILRQIDAIGELGEYFRTVRIQGEMAQKAIDTDEAERELLLNEAAESDEG